MKLSKSLALFLVAVLPVSVVTACSSSSSSGVKEKRIASTIPDDDAVDGGKKKKPTPIEEDIPDAGPMRAR